MFAFPFFLKIAKDGSVFTWGRAVRGQLGREPEPQDHPKSVNLNAPGQSTFDINIKFYYFGLRPDLIFRVYERAQRGIFDAFFIYISPFK